MTNAQSKMIKPTRTFCCSTCGIEGHNKNNTKFHPIVDIVFYPVVDTISDIVAKYIEDMRVMTAERVLINEDGYECLECGKDGKYNDFNENCLCAECVGKMVCICGDCPKCVARDEEEEDGVMIDNSGDTEGYCSICEEGCKLCYRMKDGEEDYNAPLVCKYCV